MEKRAVKIIAIFLLAAMMLCGCSSKEEELFETGLYPAFVDLDCGFYDILIEIISLGNDYYALGGLYFPERMKVLSTYERYHREHEGWPSQDVLIYEFKDDISNVPYINMYGSTVLDIHLLSDKPVSTDYEHEFKPVTYAELLLALNEDWRCLFYDGVYEHIYYDCEYLGEEYEEIEFDVRTLSERNLCEWCDLTMQLAVAKSAVVLEG